MENVSVQIINELLEIIKSSKQFILDQAPEVFREMILAARIESTAQYFIFIVLIYACIRFWKFAKTKARDGYCDCGVFVVPLIASIAVTVYGLVLFTCGLHTFLTAFFAPKVYLLEQLSQMRK